MSQNFLDHLSPEQRQAAANIQGATLIVAGAGSGKTRTLTYRIANMIDKGIAPHEILVLTFTNKAAAEMKERIAQVLPPTMLRGLWMGTFHSVFMRILGKEAALIGYPENFTIYDTADSRNLVKAIIKEMELPDDKYKPADVFNRISMAKNSMTSPAAYSQNTAARQEDEASKRPQIFEIYARYARKCKENGAMDFDDLLYQMNVLLKYHPEVAEKYANTFKYIMVDEYQDTNHSQYLIVKQLASRFGNICVVGDDSQSIYSFRGARIENILRFQKDFPNAQTYRLEQNYRSTKNIVDASNSLINHNKGKLEKSLYSKNPDGEKIRVLECFNDKDEAIKVIREIYNKIYVENCSPGDIAILYRTNQQSRELEEQLLKKGVAYKIYKGASFYSRKEVKDMLCYLRLAVNPADDESLKRIINVPARGIGAVSIDKIEGLAVERGVSMTQIIRDCSPGEIGISGKAANGVLSFVEAFNSFSDRAATADAYEFAMDVAHRSGLIAFFQASKAIEDKSRLDNIEELLNSIKTFSRPEGGGEGVAEVGDGSNEDMGQENGQEKSYTIYEWLSEVSLISDTDDKGDDGEPKVGLMTIHSSKGLEFKYVYIVGVEEGMIPSIRGESDNAELEEERRLFYVAITRAKTAVMLSYAQRRFKWGQMTDSEASRFIDEIDQKHLDITTLDNSDLAGSGVGGGGYQQNMFGARRGNGNSGWSGGGYGGGGYGGGGYGGGYKKTWGAGKPARSTASTPPQPPKPQLSQADFNRINQPNMRKVEESYQAARQIDSAGDLRVGMRVTHERFGKGVVEGLEATATDVKVTVNFDAMGTKTLLSKFAKLRAL